MNLRLLQNGFFTTCLLLLSVGSSLGGTGRISGLKDYKDHECIRECNGTVRTCEYDFTVEWYHVLTKACYNCPFNATDCARPHCVAADGAEKAVLTINRMIPSPSIIVCRGDTIVANLHNKISNGEGTSIHWHGQHQENTPHMDGVSMLTQCPIPPHTSFQYKFKADYRGTHFYHGHSGLQRADGIFGPLIVREENASDAHSGNYDYDLPEHVVMVTDWLVEMTVNRFTAHHNDDGDNKPKSMLINGKGAWKLHTDAETGEEAYTPKEVFTIAKGKRYRFRMINNGILNCPIQVSVDGHNLTMIATDGSPFEPVEVENFIIFAGERYDFVLNANQNVSNYWMKLKGLADCSPSWAQAHQTAIIRYEGAANENPPGPTGYEDTGREGKQLNPLNTKKSDMHIPVSELMSLDPDDERISGTPDHQLHLAMDFNKVDNEYFHNPTYYPIYQISRKKHLYSPQMNGITMVIPSSPPLTQPEDITEDTFCNETSLHGECREKFCECTHVLRVGLDSLVEIVFVDQGFTFNANHPMHLHGYAFHVVGLRRVNASGFHIDTFKEMDARGEIERRFTNVVRKDSVTVPDGGYTIIRFVARNPGYWFLHCHIVFHAEIGMGVVLHVGEPDDLPDIPSTLPKCGNWNPDMKKEEMEHTTEPGTVPTCPSLKDTSEAALRVAPAFSAICLVVIITIASIN
ncbi:unnamed protein product [Owenia fusiformis]|uniref:Uncharacterized protein n=1 Tax=Owenia fusiformis TaxID=6347 RepID=A0A8S4NKT7_OWEFU|nr:unnamed protein product [Owenia fusiformis]